MKARWHLSKKDKQVIKDTMQEERTFYTLAMIKLCAYVMYCEWGFGKKRLERLLSQMMQYVGELNVIYDEFWVDKIDADLKRAGIEIKMK